MQDKAGREDRAWMLRVFAQLCVDYVQGSDLEIAEALSAQVRSSNLRYNVIPGYTVVLGRPNGSINAFIHKLLWL